MLLNLTIAQGISGPKEIRLPIVARVAGITLGETTVEQFEARHGKGNIGMGGHSNSGRGWYEARRGWVIDADGFNFWKGKEIIDDLRIYPEKPTGVPHIHLKGSELGLLSKISFGEPKADVERAVGQKINEKSWTNFEGLIQYPRKPVNKDSRTYKLWAVVFVFDQGKLTALQMEAD